eukprot:TRINITY_DN20259_c0_g1_i1.p1 TRINITY_DN20259_c0_g1~~TRINITY_DN20259_c0_g1_i1.p1  ORF type:complete len:271 (+),score=76.60 TRINITY_DN20259_c0_g1_i1:58-870(+)
MQRSKVDPIWWGVPALLDIVCSYIDPCGLRPCACVCSVFAESCHRALMWHKAVCMCLQQWAGDVADWSGLYDGVSDAALAICDDPAATFDMVMRVQLLHIRIVCLDQQRARQEIEGSAAEMLCMAAGIEKAVADGLLTYMRRHEGRLRTQVHSTQEQLCLARERVSHAEGLLRSVEDEIEHKDTAVAFTGKEAATRALSLLVDRWGTEWLTHEHASRLVRLSLLGMTDIPSNIQLLDMCDGDVEAVLRLYSMLRPQGGGCRQRDPDPARV